MIGSLWLRTENDDYTFMIVGKDCLELHFILVNGGWDRENNVALIFMLGNSG